MGSDRDVIRADSKAAGIRGRQFEREERERRGEKPLKLQARERAAKREQVVWPV